MAEPRLIGYEPDLANPFGSLAATEEDEDGNQSLVFYDPDADDPETCCFKYARKCSDDSVTGYRRLVADIDYAKRYTVVDGVTIYLYFDAGDDSYIGTCNDPMTATTDPCPEQPPEECLCVDFEVTIANATDDHNLNDITAINGTWQLVGGVYEDANVLIQFQFTDTSCYSIAAISKASGGEANFFSTGDCGGGVDPEDCPCPEDCSYANIEGITAELTSISCDEEGIPLAVGNLGGWWF